MKKTTPMVGVLFCVILLITGCGTKQVPIEDTLPGDVLQAKQEASVGGEEKTQQETGNISKKECLAGCELARKANEANAEKPAEQMSSDCEDLCNAQQGMQNNNLAGCAASDNPLLQASCYTEVAKNTKDPAVCEKITDVLIKDTCYTAVAEAKKDPAICDAITNALFKDGCLQGVQNQ